MLFSEEDCLLEHFDRAGSGHDAAPGNNQGNLTIDNLGKVQISGQLAEGSKFTQSSQISKRGELPLYVFGNCL
jgi:hypothetical protein